MARRSAAQVWGSVVLSSCGTLALAAGLFGASVLPPMLLGMPGATASIALGSTFLVTGLLFVSIPLQRSPEPMPRIPAHIAFIAKPKPVAMPHLISPPRPKPKPAPPQAEALTTLEVEIRDLTRQISKAGVMLATGQISEEGYAHYVEELKRRRGALEASRVKLELHRRF